MPSDKRTCSVSECTRGVYAKDLCNMHWQRQRRTGSTEVVRRSVQAGLSVEDRFRAYGWTEDVSGCWLWAGPVEEQGYGTLKVGGKTYKAHRVSYETHKRPITEGMHVLHSCDVRQCVRPEHLREGVWLDNAQDREIRGRSGVAKLTAREVKQIRTEYVSGATQEELGLTYGVSFQNVSRIVRRESWKHV